MPRLPPTLLKSSFYLYPSTDDAQRGSNIGGTGFFVGVPSAYDASKVHTIAVTNWHVAVEGGCPVIRVNKAGGKGVDIFDFDCSEWAFAPRSYDLAAIHVPIGTEHDIAVITTSMFVTKEAAERHKIYPGEDVFMVGRFIDHDGKEQNVPSVRFGNISMSPGAPIKQPNGAEMPSYCIDLRSKGGFSGSPVFVYRTSRGDMTLPSGLLGVAPGFIFLLGVHWGQFPEFWEITPDGGIAQGASRSIEYVIPGKYVRGLSGITCVAPAWAILELLEQQKIQEAIATSEAKLSMEQASCADTPVPELKPNNEN